VDKLSESSLGSLLLSAFSGEGGYIGLGGGVDDVAGMDDDVAVIGENMKDRILPYADEIGARYYEGMDYNYEFIKSTYGEGVANEMSLMHNQNWIESLMASGAEIVDIGPDFPRRLEFGKTGISRNYEMERMLTKNYPEYNKAFLRINKLEGGVPGFDPGI
jgi:hypothetical protein